jgi:hypothetical protein
LWTTFKNFESIWSGAFQALASKPFALLEYCDWPIRKF